MKVLILGITGTLGHKLYQVLSADHQTYGTTRADFSTISGYGIFHEPNIISHVDAADIDRIRTAVDKIKPAVIINCIGIVKSVKSGSSNIDNIRFNALFPHQLYRVCQDLGPRLIHISTDCVFSGSRGNYAETDKPDAEDIYGRSKLLGEISGKNAVTVRTSFIGRELSARYNLIEWFLSNRGNKIQGYSGAIFSGFPTICLARIISSLVQDWQGLSGIFHVSAEPVSKYDLLKMIRNRMNLDIEIEEYSSFKCDRSLNSALFRSATGFNPSSWEQMLDEFALDASQYVKWRPQ